MRPDPARDAQSGLVQQSDAFASFLADIPLRKVYIHDYQRRLGQAQHLTASGEDLSLDPCHEHCGGKSGRQPDITEGAGPVKAKHLRSVFVHAFGKSWLDVARQDTELNILLSSPIFRHANDAEAADLRRKTDNACLT